MKALLTIIAALFLSSFCFAQVKLDTLDKARKIKLLLADRESVRKAFDQFDLDEDRNADYFESADAEIEVFYSTGKCDKDQSEVWNVAKDKAVLIEIEPNGEFHLADFGFDLSNFLKERRFEDDDEAFVYHDKTRGAAIYVDADVVNRIVLFPPVTSKANACKYKEARKFISEKSWFAGLELGARKFVCIMLPANVTNLALSHHEISATVPRQIDISTTAVDPENDVLTYNYTVSVGKIVGTGAKVVWDLSGVPPGTHTITAGVDDGCGLCGQTKTMTVVVK